MAGAWSCCGRTGENCCRQSSSEQVNHISHWKCAKVITNTRKGAFWCSFLEYATWSISGSLFYCKYFFFIFCIFCNLRWSWSSLCFTSSTSNSNRQGHLHAVTFLLLLLLMIFFPYFFCIFILNLMLLAFWNILILILIYQMKGKLLNKFLDLTPSTASEVFFVQCHCLYINFLSR